MMIDLLTSFGNPAMKFMKMFTQMMVGIVKSCKHPSGFSMSPLCHYLVSHLATKVLMFFFMPS